jgi:hypothetical protein
MGRPTKLTPELQKAICDAIQGGCYVETACLASGIDESTYYRWLEKGGQGQQPYRDFRDAVKKAEAHCEKLAVGTVLRVAFDPENPNWQAAMTYLERRHPERWGRRDRLRAELTGKNAGPVQVEARNDADSIRQVIELVGVLAGQPGPAGERAGKNEGPLQARKYEHLSIEELAALAAGSEAGTPAAEGPLLP